MNWLKEAERFERLAFDLRLIAANSGKPTVEQLASAPTLSTWRRSVSAASVLIGSVQGHPRVGPGPIVTSLVIADGPDWARTLSRFYILNGLATNNIGSPLSY